MGKKLDEAIAWAITKFRPIFIDEIVKWEQEGEHPQGRPWWSQEDIRSMCEYPDGREWGPLGRALHEELGLIFKHRGDHSHGYSFAIPGDRARMVRYAASRQFGSAKRMAFLLEAGTAVGALHGLDQESLEAESRRLHDKHGVTFQEIARAMGELHNEMFTTEILALLGRDRQGPAQTESGLEP